MPGVSDHLSHVNGRRIHYRDWGARDAQPIVLVHGYPGNAHVWDGFAEAMSPHYRLIAVDLCGHGESDWADDYSFAGWVDDLRVMAADLALSPFTFLGHSLGSTIGFRFAESYPAMLDQLVAVDGLPLGSWEPTTPNAGALPAAFSSLEECVAFYRRTRPSVPEKAIHNSIPFDLRATEAGGFVWRHDLAVRDAILRELRFDERWKAAAARTVVRVTYLRCGRTHVGSYESTAAILAHFPTCDLIDIPDVEHAVPTRHPEVLVSVVSSILRDAE